MGDLRASSTNAAERDAYERMILDAQRAACFRYFEKWSFRVVQMKRLSKKVSVHLQRVQRQVMASRDFKIMWPGERIGALLKMWRRYTRFQKSVRNGRDTDEPPQMQWSDLPQLDAWDGKHILNSKKKEEQKFLFFPSDNIFLFLFLLFFNSFLFSKIGLLNLNNYKYVLSKQRRWVQWPSYVACCIAWPCMLSFAKMIEQN